MNASPWSSEERAEGGPAVRLGIVSYLNARPLTYGIEGAANGVEPHYDIPSVCARRLEEGETDLALIPSIEYARIPGLAIVPGISIASRGPVRSVLLVSRRPVSRIRSIALDSGSRASEALLRILCRKVFGIDPVATRMPPDLASMLRTHDAALLIGDAALDAKRDGLVTLDLGDEWARWTGLPFVYAFWAGFPVRVPTGTVATLHRTRDAGLLAVEEISREHAGADEERARSAASYIREAIHYDLGAREIEGLRRFYALAYELDLIASVPEIRFLEDSR